jgi:hypothetical protein
MEATQTDTSKRPRTTLIAFAVAGVMALVAAGALGALLAGDDDETDQEPTATLALPASEVATQSAPTPEAGTAAVMPDADDAPIAAADLRRIEAAALELAGAGEVTEIDRSDDAGEAYEVEVLTDAGVVDIALDENLRRVPNLRYDELDDDGL